MVGFHHQKGLLYVSLLTNGLAVKNLLLSDKTVLKNLLRNEHPVVKSLLLSNALRQLSCIWYSSNNKL